MKETPILFQGEMIRAILEDRKSQTRRLVKVHPAYEFCEMRDGRAFFNLEKKIKEIPLAVPYCGVDCPFRARLWVKETFRFVHDPATCRDGALEIDYRADEKERIMDRIGKGKWKPSIFMPKYASRITLEVTAVRVERLQDISTADCYDEGIQRPAGPKLGSEVTERDNARHQYQTLWNSIHIGKNGGKPVASWQSNPWVWRIMFSRIKT